MIIEGARITFMINGKEIEPYYPHDYPAWNGPISASLDLKIDPRALRKLYSMICPPISLRKIVRARKLRRDIIRGKYLLDLY